MKLGTLVPLLGAALACAPGATAVDPPDLTPPDEVPPAHVRTCVPPAGVSGSPQSIEEAVALINALPKPTSVACLVESLDRPLRLTATSSVSSAQPAGGARSPRIFLFSGPLIVSVVPEGVGAKLVEFSVLGKDGRSRKGELVFPVQAPLAPQEPYARIMFNDRVTSCGLCHREERFDAQVGGAWSYSSQALRPVDSELVPLQALRKEAAACDAGKEPGRCALLHALFAGEVQEQDFPRELPTFFD